MRKLYTPPSIPIPSEYADSLGCDASHIYHINAGHRRFSIPMACQLLDVATGDERLAGLTILDLRPELICAVPHLYAASGTKKDKKSRARRKSKRNKS
jgi:hypothetical protein